MNYSNGFDLDLVLPALKQRVGWLQPSLVDSPPTLTDDNMLSKSGRYYNDGSFHAMCTIANLLESQEVASIPDDDFNAYLDTLQNSMISRSLNEVFRKPELIEQCLLYTRFGRNDYVLPNQNQYVGWIIETARDQSISTQITMGTFYFDTDVEFNMYLFQDGVQQPIQTIPVSVTAWQHTVVDFDNLVLNFKTGYRYYFVYNQNELGNAKAVRELTDSFAKTLCFQAYTFQADVTTDGFAFNHNNPQYPALPAGVNLEIISFKDHTQKIVRNAFLFDELQGLQMAAMVIEQVNMSTRTNFTQRQNQQQSTQLDRDLNQAYPTNEVPVTSGIKSRILGEFKRIRNTFFPPPEPLSSSMETCNGGLDAYEQNWKQMNERVALNPGVYVS